MLLSATGDGLYPLVLSVSGGEESPFFVNVLIRLGLALGYLSVAWVMWRGALSWDTVRMFTRGFSETKLFLVAAAVAGNFDSVCFGLALRYVDVSIVLVATQMWPVPYTILRCYLFGEPLDRVGWMKLGTALLVGYVGVIIVMDSQSGGLVGLGSGWAMGITLCLITAGLSGLPIFALRLGRDLAKLVDGGGPGFWRRELALVLLVALSMNLMGATGSLILGVAVGESWPSGSGFGYWLPGVVLLGSLVSNTVPAVCHTFANLISSRAGVNALAYLTPVAATLFLWAFWSVGVTSWPMFWTGVAVVVGSNALLLGGAVKPDA